MNESKQSQQSQILHNKKIISIENCDFKKNHVINRFY